MMKKFLLMLLPLAALVAGCRYDDSEVWEELNNHEARLLALEKTINNDLATLKGLVSQLEANVYVSNVTSTADGFTITFTDGQVFTITNGSNGESGAEGKTPVIGVKQDTDGHYYWTLNGDWLTDASGNKIRTTGDDGLKGDDGQPGRPGDDAVAPKVKLENNKWYISTDNGATWTEAGDAAVVGESLFKSVALDESGKNVVFTFQDDSTIVIPIAPEVKKLQLLFDESAIMSILSGETATADYTISGPEDETVEFDTFENGGYSVVITPADAVSGTIAVTAPDPAVKGKILFILTGSKGSSFVKTVTINGDPSLSADKTEYNVDSKGGELTISVKANVSYTSVIEDGADWITVGLAANKFNIAENASEDDRTATITFKADGLDDVSVKVTQAAKSALVLVTESPVVDATDGTLDVVVRTNATVTATPLVEWIHVSEGTKALTEKTFSFTIDANTGDERTGDIEFAAEGLKQTITVTQKSAVLTIAQIKAASNGSIAGSFKDVKVSYVVGSYTYIEDETGGIPVYKNGGVGLKAGQVINGPVSGTKGVYGNAPQLTALVTSSATITEGEAPLTEITLSELLEDYDSYFGRRIKLADVTVTQAMSASARTGKISQGDNEYQLYNSDTRNALELTAGDVVDLVCFPSSYNGTKQASVYTGLATVKGGKQEPELKFVDNFTLKVGESQTVSATTNSDGAIKYSSSDPSVATVGETDGVVNAVAAGTATITATLEETAAYSGASASFTLTVVADGGDDTDGVKKVTVAEFIAAEVSTEQWYQLTGIISNVVSTVYGNFNLTDETGTVYIYGLAPEKTEGSNPRTYSTLGLKAGDEVTIVSHRTDYNGTPQGGGTPPAYYVSHRPAASLSVAKEQVAIKVGETFDLAASTNGGAISYSSSDESVATVAGGIITGVSKGDAVITVSVAANGEFIGVSKTVNVSVSAANEKIVWAKKSFAELASGDVIVIVSTKGANYKAMSNDKGTSAAPAAVNVTLGDGVLSADPDANIQWTVSVEDGIYTFYKDATKAAWLYCTNANNGLRVGTTSSSNTFNVTNNYLYNVGQRRYVGVYNNADWRSYTSINNNITGQTFDVYVKTAVAE